jgi:hypothetical protein
MQLEHLLNGLTPEIYQRLCQCVETGKWLDGTALTEHQRGQCMQAIMVYQAKISTSAEHMTVGSDGGIVHKSKSELRQELRQDLGREQAIGRFKQDDL